MTQYIDKDSILAEIEERRKEAGYIWNEKELNIEKYEIYS